MEEPIYRFPVDLEREEYVNFAYLQATRYNPKRQKGLFVGISLVCIAVLVALLVSDVLYTKKVDWMLVAVLPLMLVPLAYVLWILPSVSRRRSEKAFDKAIKAGRHFFGEVLIYPDRVEKQTVYGCVKIPLHGHSFFVETPALMAFVSHFAPAIILPRRCMTEEAAAAARKAAEQLPIPNRRFFGRLQPLAQPIAVPVEREPLPRLWECQFTYTGEELVESGKRALIANYWRMGPLFALFSLLLSFTTHMNGSETNILALIITFLIAFGVLTLLNLVLPLGRVRRSADFVPREDRTKQVHIDEMGFFIHSEKNGDLLLSWKEEDIHVYDKEPFAEVTVGKRVALYLPKRCIENVEAFNAVIAQCRKG